VDPLPTKEKVEVVIRNLLPVPLNLYPASWQTAIPRMVEKELKFVRKMGSKNPCGRRFAKSSKSMEHS